MRQGTILAAAGVAGLLMALLYATRLDYSPAYLTHDEVNFSLQSASIAATGRDINGRLLPVYFSEPEFAAGRDPLPIYTTALVLQFLPLSDASVRIPTALVAVVTVLLLLGVTARITNRVVTAIVAALCLALSPGLFLHGRLALSVIYPLPFVVGWLWTLHEYDSRPAPWRLGAGALLLGLATYGYLAALVMLPVYLLMTVWLARAWREPRLLMWIAAGVLIALLPTLIWTIAHPERYADLLHAYRVGDPNASQAPSPLTYEGLRTRLGTWWLYFNPDFLFLSGDTSLTNSTRSAGFFPAACAVFLPMGIYRWARGSRFERLLLAGLITGPLAVVATGSLDLNRYRAMFVLPFGALAAAYGWQALQQSRHRWQQVLAVLLLATVPWQFAVFYRDYMGRYRETSSTWFGRNLRGALEHVYQHRQSGETLLVSNRVPYADSYGRFYSRVFTQVVEAPTVVIGEELEASRPAPGAWLIAAPNEAWLSRLSSQEWRTMATIVEPTGESSFVVLQRAAQ